MILDGYWKKELKNLIKELRFWQKLSNWKLDYVEHKINRVLLLSAIIVRKIIEDEEIAKKEIEKLDMRMPSFKILNTTIRVLNYPFVGDKDFVAHKICVEDYDLPNDKKKEVRLKDCCNWMIHAYIWDLLYERKPDKAVGFGVASDRNKTKELYLVRLDDWAKKLEFCIENSNI